jgi:hypothetical protein
MDWFNSKYSDADLAEILSDYSKSVFGYRNRMYGAGRATLARELEQLDATVARMRADPAQREALIEQGWIFPEENLSPFNTVNS